MGRCEAEQPVIVAWLGTYLLCDRTLPRICRLRVASQTPTAYSDKAIRRLPDPPCEILRSLISTVFKQENFPPGQLPR